MLLFLSWDNDFHGKKCNMLIFTYEFLCTYTLLISYHLESTSSTLDSFRLEQQEPVEIHANGPIFGHETKTRPGVNHSRERLSCKDTALSVGLCPLSNYCPGFVEKYCKP